MAKLNALQRKWNDENPFAFSDLKVLFLNCTLKRSPEISHTMGLIALADAIFKANGVSTIIIRPVDYKIAFGVYPDMRERGWEHDEWPTIQKELMEADILVIGTPI